MNDSRGVPKNTNFSTEIFNSEGILVIPSISIRSVKETYIGNKLTIVLSPIDGHISRIENFIKECSEFPDKKHTVKLSLLDDKYSIFANIIYHEVSLVDVQYPIYDYQAESDIVKYVFELKFIDKHTEDLDVLGKKLE